MTEEPSEQPVVRDRRRIDPETGKLRAPTEAPLTEVPSDHEEPVAETSEAAARVAELEEALAERTADLQRLQAEYRNYKRRVDRDRDVVRDTAIANVLTSLLPVLDDIDRAREHGEVEGGFKAVADSLTNILVSLGLERYGRPGDEFDPRLHEALMHDHSDEATGPTCSAILQPGYRIGERILRPARVAVAEPSTPAEATAETVTEHWESADGGEAPEGSGSTDEAAGGPPPHPDERED